MNLTKTKELVFRRLRAQYFHLTPAVYDIKQVNCCKWLGVIFPSNFKMDSHVQHILSSVLSACTFFSSNSISWLLLLHTPKSYHVFSLHSRFGEGLCRLNSFIKWMHSSVHSRALLTSVIHYITVTKMMDKSNYELLLKMDHPGH